MPQDHRGRLEQAQIETNLKMARWTKVVGVFTAVLAVVSILTGGFTAWQADTAATTARETREQLRAVMQLTGIGYLYAPAAETGELAWGFTANFQNFGGTRAAGVSGEQSAQYFDGTVPNNTDFSKPKVELEKIAPNIVGAGATVTIQPVAIKPDDVQKALRKEGVIVVWGKMRYSDIFNPNQEHVISFCQRVIPVQPPNKDAPLAFNIGPFRPDCNKAN
jgi:hypothetical protein